MAVAQRSCMYDCTYPAAPGKRKCVWHGLLSKPIEVQIEAADQRREHAHNVFKAGREIFVGALWPAKTIPKSKWPDGERFCSGCQGFVPLFYCTGTRCRAHAAAASHDARLSKEYGIDRPTYLALLELQGGRCYICRQEPKTKRLAVDHDHRTGEVRGLLCADVERGCNHAVLGSIEAHCDDPIAAFQRAIDYLTKTPYQRLKEMTDGNLLLRQTAQPRSDDRGTGGDGQPAASGRGSSEDPLRAAAPDWA